MAKVEIVSWAKIEEWNNGASSKQKAYVSSSDEEVGSSISGGMSMTSDSTSHLAYEAHKRGR